MIKKMLLFFLCFTLLAIPGCKKKLPTQPDIPTKILPTIESFTATPESMNPGELSILSWSVKNATNVTIDQGVGTVSPTDTTEVSPEETTTYTLTATNSDGSKTSSCTVAILNLPVIEYFTANPESIILGEWSLLSWSTTNAATLAIEPLGNLTIPWAGSHPVSPTETTLYTLIATNSDGQTTSSCIVEIKQWAVLELSTTPESPMFWYDQNSDTCTSDFTVNMTETVGVGGQIVSLLIGGFLTIDPQSICNSDEFGGGIFNPFGTLSRFCEVVIPCKPAVVMIYIQGIDNHGYGIEQSIYFTITWTQSAGTMRFLKIVEGASHHKLIK